MNAQPCVLVTDGDQRSTLAVVRSLGKAGLRVIVACTGPLCLAGASRFASETVLVPDSMSDPEGFVERMDEHRRTLAPDFVLPMTEASLRLLLAREDEGFPGRLLSAGQRSFEAVSDKATVLRAARDEGIPEPTRLTVESPADIANLQRAELKYPVVMKPARSVYSDGEARHRGGVSYAQDSDQLTRQLTALPSGAFPVLVQRRLTGPGYGVFLLVWNGETVARFGHRRLREKPPSGGVSVYRESVVIPEKLLEWSERLLKRFDWSGPAMVEFKSDGDGSHYLMEINGRFWGSLQLAVDSGVDFPHLLLSAALGRTPKRVDSYVVGRRSRWLMGDLDHLLLRLFGKTEAGGIRSQARAIAHFLLPWRPGDRFEVLRLSDPMPFLTEVRTWFRSLLGTGK